MSPPGRKQDYSRFFKSPADGVTKISQTSSSPHFVTSPCSAFGSMHSVPFILNEEHFEICPKFHLQDSADLNRRVRHLCANACYLRAYAPAREWLSLRQIILEEMEDASPGMYFPCAVRRLRGKLGDSSVAHLRRPAGGMALSPAEPSPVSQGMFL